MNLSKDRVQKKSWILGLAFALMLGFSMAGCSGSSEVQDGEELAEEGFFEEESDANTDPIPEENAELGSNNLEESETGGDLEAPKDDQNVAAPEPSTFDEEGVGSYTAQKGDTLMKIAFNLYGNIFKWREIFEMNQDVVSDVNTISAGTVLKVRGQGHRRDRPGEKYKIKRGDTLGSISHGLYGNVGYWKHLRDYNDDLIKDPNKIYAGFYLFYLPKDQIEPTDTRPAPIVKRNKPAPIEQGDTASVQPSAVEEPVVEEETLEGEAGDESASVGGDTPEALLQKGEKDFNAKNYDRALASFRQSRQADETQMRPWFYEIRTLRKLNREAEAKEVATTLLQKKPHLKNLPMFQAMFKGEATE